MAYHLAPTLAQLRSEINAVFPNRSKVSDGWIGDTSHSARKSDHNPDYASGGVVRAIDVTNDGINVDALIVCAISDWRVAYVISRGLIYVRDNGFRPQKYTGSNGHYHHVHISIRHGAGYENSTASWEYAKRARFIAPSVPDPVVVVIPEPEPEPEEEEIDMILIRNETSGAVILYSGGVSTKVVGQATKGGPTNYAMLMAAGVKSVNVTQAQYDAFPTPGVQKVKTVA